LDVEVRPVNPQPELKSSLYVILFVLLSSTSSPSRLPLLLWVRRATSVDADAM
jgi:hypothetical protein